MRFFPAEPDIATVFRRISEKDIDLQPDFQRGEVWPTQKKQRLIDSILRGWVIPPVLLISHGHGEPQEVLDGQQRLASIRDFMLNEFPIDGRIEPADPSIQALHGIKFNALPTEVSKAFLRTAVRMYEITDYRPEEPAEIFFRLNQPTGLTSAEKRNAFFGPVRDEIRRVVDKFKEDVESSRPLFGFSNSRMAYDDVFARFVCTLEMNTLHSKVTAAAVDKMYRGTSELRPDVLWRLENAVQISLKVFDIAIAQKLSEYPRLNKATFFSWLLFFSRLDSTGDLESVSSFFVHFEAVRARISGASAEGAAIGSPNIPTPLLGLMLAYSDRASARVADVSSVLLRDFALWASWHSFYPNRGGCTDPAYKYIGRFFEPTSSFDLESNEGRILDFIEAIGWGRKF